jgi:hypothetical protein
MRDFIPFYTALALASGCAVDRSSSVTSAVNTDPGETTLSFHSPSGIDVEMRSVLPAGQPDPIYLKFGGITGESTGIGRDVIFRGSVEGVMDEQHYAAAIVPLTAVLLGFASMEQVQESTGLTYSVVQIQYMQQDVSPPRDVAVSLVQQAATYALLKEGPAAGSLANSYIAILGIDPCPIGPVVK